MNPDIFTRQLQYAFQGQLPAQKAFQQMTPSFRPLNRSEIDDITQYKDAAVAIICYKKKDEIHLILILRPTYNGHHSGQIGLPGGKYDPADQTLEKTAQRETKEEIGWTIEQQQCAGKLTELFIPESKFRVQPFVFYCPNEQLFIPDKHEVEKIISFPIDLLNDPKAQKKTSIRLTNGRIIPNVPYFEIDQHVVWGATAIILNEFKWMIFTK